MPIRSGAVGWAYALVVIRSARRAALTDCYDDTVDQHREDEEDEDASVLSVVSVVIIHRCV